MKHCISFQYLALCLSLLVMLPTQVPGQELDPSVMERVKSATVFIRAGKNSGTGFLFKNSSGTGHLMTCAHVVAVNKEVEVVFRSGSTNQWTHTATVIAVDTNVELACLMVREATNLPPALTLKETNNLHETMDAFVFGFLFGNESSIESTPAISISKGSVSCLRRSKNNETGVVELSGNANPGNGGGPVVNAAGEVVGIAHSKAFLSQMTLTIPVEDIQAFLRGRVADVLFRAQERTTTTANVEISVTMADPFKALKEVGVVFCRKDSANGLTNTMRNEHWFQADPSMQKIPCRINEAEAKAVGVFQVSRRTNEPFRANYYFQGYATAATGEVFYTRLGEFPVEFTPEPKAPAEVKRPPALKMTLTTGNNLKEVARLRLDAVIAGLYLSEDSRRLYALDLTAGMVYEIDAETLRILRKVAIDESAVRLECSPRAERLYVIGTNRKTQTPQGAAYGIYLQTITTKNMELVSSFSPKSFFQSFVGRDDGIAYAIGETAQLDVIDTQARQVAESYHFGGSHPCLHPDQQHIYLCNLGSSRLGVVAIGQNGSLGQSPFQLNCLVSESVVPDAFALAPDWVHLITYSGIILEIAQPITNQLTQVARIAPFNSIITARGCGTFFTRGDDDELREYHLGEFTLKKTFKLDKRVSQLVLDPQRGRLYGVEASQTFEASRRNMGLPLKLVLGELVAYSIGSESKQ